MPTRLTLSLLVSLLVLALAASARGQGRDVADPRIAPTTRGGCHAGVVAGELRLLCIDRGRDGIDRLLMAPVDRLGRQLSVPREIFARPGSLPASVFAGLGSTLGSFVLASDRTEAVHFAADGSVLTVATLPAVPYLGWIAADDETICILQRDDSHPDRASLRALLFEFDGRLRAEKTVDLADDGLLTSVQADGAGDFLLMTRRVRSSMAMAWIDRNGTTLSHTSVVTKLLGVAVRHDSVLLLDSSAGGGFTVMVVARDGRTSEPVSSPPLPLDTSYRALPLQEGGYLVVDSRADARESEVGLTRIAPDGTLSVRVATRIAQPLELTSVAAVDSVVYGIFSVHTISNTDARVAGLVQQPLALAPLVTGPADQVAPNIAAAGDHFVATWIDDGPGDTTMRAAILDSRGTRLGAPFLLFPLPQRGLYDVRLATNGSVHLALWNDDGTIRAVRFRASGVLDPEPIVIGRGDVPAVASDGRDFLIVWSAPPAVGSGAFAGGLRAAALAAETGSVTRAVALTPALVDDVVHSAGLAWNGSEYVVGYQTGCLCTGAQPCTPYTASTLRVSANGNLRGAPVTVLPGGKLLAIASNGRGETLSICWRDGRTLGIFQRGDAAPAAPFAIFAWPYDHLARASFDGADYLVAVSPYAAGETALTLARIRTNGTVQLDGALPSAGAVADIAARHGTSLMVTSQARAGSPYIHVLAYTPEDLPPAPAPPPTPFAVRLFGRNPGVVTWSGGDGATSLVLERRTNGVWRPVVSSDTARVREQKAGVVWLRNGADATRLRLMNAGGASEASAEVVPEPPRRRPSD